MNDRRFLGWTCGLLAVLAVRSMAIGARAGAMLTTVAGAGVGRILEVSVEAPPVWVEYGDETPPHIFNAVVPTLVNAMVGQAVSRPA